MVDGTQNRASGQLLDRGVSKSQKPTSPNNSFTRAFNYNESYLAHYGLNEHGELAWMTRGFWLLGKCYPKVLYKVNWIGDSAGGAIAVWTAEWEINDFFDFVPGKDQNLGYRIAATLFGPVFYGLLGARNRVPIQAKWAESGTIPIPPAGVGWQTIPTDGIDFVKPISMPKDKTNVAKPTSVRIVEEHLKHHPTGFGAPQKKPGSH